MNLIKEKIIYQLTKNFGRVVALTFIIRLLIFISLVVTAFKVDITWVRVLSSVMAFFYVVYIMIILEEAEAVFWGESFYEKNGVHSLKRIKLLEKEKQENEELKSLENFFKATPNILIFVKAHKFINSKADAHIHSEVFEEFIRLFEMKEPLPVFIESFMAKYSSIFSEMNKLLEAAKIKDSNLDYYDMLVKTFTSTETLIENLYNENLGSINYEDRLKILLNTVVEKQDNSMHLNK